MGQATEWCHHQQNVYQLKPEHACGSSVDVEGSNNAEVVATVGIPDFSAGKTTGGIYIEGTGNLNIQTAKVNDSVGNIFSEVGKKASCPSCSRTVLLSLI